MTSKTLAASKTVITLFTTTKAIDAAIQEIHTTGQTRQTLMHKTACSILKHVGTHKDTRIVLRFIEGLVDSDRKNSLKQWFETFGAIRFNENGCQYMHEGKFRLGDAMDKPFWKFKANEGMPYEALDFTKYVEQQIKKLEKDVAAVPALDTSDPRCILLAAMKGCARPAAPTVQ